MEGTKMSEEKIKISCPVCNSELTTSVVEKVVPHFGEILIISDICNNCGYHNSTIHVTGSSNKTHYELLIDSREKLNYYVVRSPTTTVSVPELGIEMKPISGQGEAFITTVEGVLVRFKEKLLFMMTDENDDEKVRAINDLLHKIERTIKGEYCLTIVLDDPMGKAIFYKENE
ncbi:MAG: ZPR1-type zinc finger protein [Candidatus Korarchaeota archaeon]